MPSRFRAVLTACSIVVVVLALVGLRGFGGGPTPFATVFGRGPIVVLVHGLGSTPDHWLATARRLSRHHRVVLVELPGHGASAMPEPFALTQATESLDRALREQAKEPVVLVGHSIGGLVAADEALAHPARVRALVLVETALKPQVEGAERAGLLRALDTDYQAVLRSAYLAFGRDSAQGMALYRTVAALDSTTIKRWIRLAVTADLSERAAGLGVPTLAVLAERSWPRDEPWPVTRAALGYARVPRLAAVRMEGCGHFIMLDRPAELARLIERFIAQPADEPIATR